jgi:hypothetical protein
MQLSALCKERGKLSWLTRLASLAIARTVEARTTHNTRTPATARFCFSPFPILLARQLSGRRAAPRVRLLSSALPARACPRLSLRSALAYARRDARCSASLRTLALRHRAQFMSAAVAPYGLPRHRLSARRGVSLKAGRGGGYRVAKRLT